MFTLALGVSADDEILLRDDFHFDPIRAALRLILTAGTLGHYSFELVLTRELQQLFSVAGEVLRIANERTGRDERLQRPFALRKWRTAQVVAVQVDEIEGEEHDRLRARELHRRARAGADARLQRAKA